MQVPETVFCQTGMMIAPVTVASDAAYLAISVRLQSHAAGIMPTPKFPRLLEHFR